MAIHPKVVDVICFEQALLQCWYIIPSSSFNHSVLSSAIYMMPFEWTDLFTD